MCVVSFIGDQIGTVPGWPREQTDPTKIWPDVWPIKIPTEIPVVVIPDAPALPKQFNPLQITAVQDWLVKMDKILIAAKAFDEATGQPNCEIDEKMQKLKDLAEAFAVEMEFFNS